MVANCQFDSLGVAIVHQIASRSPVQLRPTQFSLFFPITRAVRGDLYCSLFVHGPGCRRPPSKIRIPGVGRRQSAPFAMQLVLIVARHCRQVVDLRSQVLGLPHMWLGCRAVLCWQTPAVTVTAQHGRACLAPGCMPRHWRLQQRASYGLGSSFARAIWHSSAHSMHSKVRSTQ